MTTVANKVAVVTGANAGLGFQTALKLARMGFKVVMACRSADKAKAAQAQLLQEVPGADTLVLPLDISDMASVREFARQFSEQIGQLDLLVNNAGIVAIPLTRNSAGHELQLATNYLGAFALTGLLLPYLRPQARVVNVGSLANRFGKFDLDDLNWETTPYNEWQGYSRSKIAMLSFTMELQRRLRASGSSAIALAAHPGFAATDILRHNPAKKNKKGLNKWIHDRMEKLIPSAEVASAPIVHAACSEAVGGGEYYGPTGFFEIGGKTGKARVNPVARNVEIGKRLWTLSETMTDVRFLSEY